MPIEMPTEEWKDPRSGLRPDPKKTDETGNTTIDRAIMNQISSLDLEEITGVIDHIEEALKLNPNLLKDQVAREKIEKANARLEELLEQNPGTIH